MSKRLLAMVVAMSLGTALAAQEQQPPTPAPPPQTPRAEQPKPAPDRGPTHDMLLQSTTLAQRALKLRMSGADPTALRNAGSAAAGALLLLDRVCIDVGCDAPPKR